MKWLLIVCALLLSACTASQEAIIDRYCCKSGTDIFLPYLKIESGGFVEYDLSFNESCYYDATDCNFINPLCYLGYFDPVEKSVNFAWEPIGNRVDIYATARIEDTFISRKVATFDYYRTYRMRIEYRGGFVTWTINGSVVLTAPMVFTKPLWISSPWMGGECEHGDISIQIRYR